jgi:CheY-like chemotaxis protein
MLYNDDVIYKDKKVLIAEDDERNIFALSSLLEEKEISIVVAKNGSDALKTLQKDSSFDLVLMDIMMPVMDGYEAMKEIRKYNRFKDLPIIALTAKAFTGDREKCIDAGASDYLSKPIEVDTFMTLLKVWL